MAVAVPTVTTAVRTDTVVFCAIEKLNDPLPDPIAPEVIVSQSESLDAVQEHTAGAVTVATPDPPAAGALVRGKPIE